MPNELTDYEHSQLLNGGLCVLHEHDVVLAEHKHVDALQSLEVVVSLAVDHVVDYREDIIIIDTTAANRVVTLPLSRGGRKFCIVKSSAANNLTVQFTGGETMFGAATVVLTAIGSKWFKGIAQGYIPL